MNALDVSGNVRAHHCGACGVRGHNRVTCPERFRPVGVPPPDPETIGEIAQLREERDALAADVVDHERIRAVVEERLAETYQRIALVDVRIRHLRGES